MSQRVTWRTRPRTNYPWPLRVIEADRSEFTSPVVSGFHSLVGPLTIHAATELIYRAKHFEFTGSTEKQIEIWNGSEYVMIWQDAEIDETTDTTVTDEDLEGDEIRVFQQASYDLVNTNPLSVYATNANSVLFAAISASPKFPFPEDFAPEDDYDIIKDELGFFWVPAAFFVRATIENEDLPTPQTVDIAGNALEGDYGYEVFTAQLVLASGTFPIDAIAYNFFDEPREIRNTELTIKAVEWWPYKTTAGDAAWNAATGAPANAGPGG